MTEQSWPQSQKSMHLLFTLNVSFNFYFFDAFRKKISKFLFVALSGPPASLAEQLKQVLAEREKRLGGNDSSRESSGDFTDLNNPHNNDPTMVTHHLVEEIRQAVNEANQRGK